MLTSRERVECALNHREPDRIPLDLGATVVSGMHVSSVYLLRQALQLDQPGTPVKVVEPYQMLGEIKTDLRDALGVDTVILGGLGGAKTFFGFENSGWKPWTFHDGTPLLVPEKFNTEPEPGGDILMYPEGDKSAPPSGKMPVGGWYFDTVIRQPPIDDEHLDPTNNIEEFGPISQEALEGFAQEANRLYNETDKAIVANFGETSFGDIALVPGAQIKHPKGIRDVAEWYVSTISRRDYVYEVFELQCEIALENMAKFYEAVGDQVTAVFVSGADFGAQNGPLVSIRTYRELFKPFHKRVNDWIHENTNWKSFLHTCGSVASFVEDFIEAGFDILNPVQTTAVGMDPVMLKSRFGNRLVFWGGGADNQRIMPFGTPDEVRAEVRRTIEILSPGGGFVFGAIHNIQARTPVENLLAFFEAFNEYRDYPTR